MSKDAMSTDNSSLDLLHDIVTPDAAFWFPLAPGWQILLALIALLILIGFLLALIRWQRNAYRREALAELKQLLDRDVPANDPERLAELSVLLKRTAITAFPRQQVASQTGPEWFAFLDHTGGTGFSTSLGSRLEQANYCSQRADWGAPQLQELADAIRLWIKRHE